MNTERKPNRRQVFIPAGYTIDPSGYKDGDYYLPFIPQMDVLITGLYLFGTGEKTFLKGIRIGIVELFACAGSIPASLFESDRMPNDLEALVKNGDLKVDGRHRVDAIEAYVGNTITLVVEGPLKSAVFIGETWENKSLAKKRITIDRVVKASTDKPSLDQWQGKLYQETLTGEHCSFEVAAASESACVAVLTDVLKQQLPYSIRYPQ
jgi:hypothetical protein